MAHAIDYFFKFRINSLCTLGDDMNEQQIKAQERMLSMVHGTYDTERKKSPTYAERQQRKAQLMRESRKAMATGDLDAVLKHRRAGRYGRHSVLNEDDCFAIAAKNGQINIVDFYINDGQKDLRIQTMMGAAATAGQIKVIDYLIEQGANKQHLNDSIYQASLHNQPKTVEHLISKGAMPGGNGLLVAAADGYIEVVKIHLEHGANIHADDDKALKNSVSRTHDEITKTLIIDFNMPIKDETKQWLTENYGQYALELLAKRDLQERLSQKYTQQPRRTLKQSKGPTMKI